MEGFVNSDILLGSKQWLFDLGKLTIADIFLNNSDRLALPVWNNDGNAGNVMVTENGGIFAIDSMVNTLDPVNTSAASFFQR